MLYLIFLSTDALSGSSLPSITENDNGSSLIAYNGQWVVINNGKLFQYNINDSCPSVWNVRGTGWSNKPLSVNLDIKYSYITLEASTDFKVTGSDKQDHASDGSLSFPVSTTCAKGSSRELGPSTLSYIYGCYATLSFTSSNIVELQFGFSSAAQRSGLSFGATGSLIFKAYI